jgi:hypothetical protein
MHLGSWPPPLKKKKEKRKGNWPLKREIEQLFFNLINSYFIIFYDLM